MQPYFFPYIGYFQLINAVDTFVIYDKIEYSKKGWINRNRILFNGNDEYFTIPLKRDSDYLNINQRYIADNYIIESKKILNKINETYRKAPFYKETYSLIKDCFLNNEKNLFLFIFNSLLKLLNFLDIKTKIIVSSEFESNTELKGENRVISICKQLNANHYINPIGGLELYSKNNFLEHKIILNFIKSRPLTYKQFDNVYVPSLSIIDVMMFNSKTEIKTLLTAYDLI